jgi:hypothetical protein
LTADWSRKFDEPIPLPKGRQLVTLKDAGTYITKLPKAEHTAAEWQAAMEALILVATLGGPTMFCAHRRHESFKPPRRACVQSIPQRDALGRAQAGARPLTIYSEHAATLAGGLRITPAFLESRRRCLNPAAAFY